LDTFEIKSLLQSLGERVPPGSQLILIGGGALALLGSPRLTVDIDFVGDDVHPSEFHRSIMQIARELKIDAEPVPLDRFVPLPVGSTARQIHIGKFGNLEIYVADPYSIALTKLDRGFDTDFDDLVFLIQQDLVSLNELERIMRDALPYARKYDLNPDIQNPSKRTEEPNWITFQGSSKPSRSHWLYALCRAIYSG
jgi:Nucleotidyl transferase AbiEii toxin, Type IV TA system